MVRFSGGLLLFTAFAATRAPPRPAQHVFDVSATRPEGNPRKLQGRFLHITDIHPDPFYQQGSDPNGEHPCHRGDGGAGYFGAEKTECDSPFSLVNATFDWIKQNLKDEIDFVIWTGDSARHDNDEKYPRTNKQVEQQNEFIVTKFDDVFGKPDNRHDPDPTNDFVVPIVPSYGNNDVLPHNIFTPGPNRWTRKFLTIWEKFVPQEQRHSFARGGWFYTEVIPNKLAVFSLNTLYFFDSNGAVDGCDDPNEPGYEHFEWLRIQLQFLRRRNMKAILTGHVPPARTEGKQNWDETCYQKYTLWLRQYRDVIVGNLFGHMNLDHFMLQDVKELTYKFKIDGVDNEGLRDRRASIKDGLRVEAKADYLSDLRRSWGNLPQPPKGLLYDIEDHHLEGLRRNRKQKRKLHKFLRDMGGPFGERFSLSVVSPSIVPNFYPTLRIVEYNITGLEHDHPALTPTALADAELDVLGNTELSHLPSGPSVHVDDSENDLSIDEDYEVARQRKHRKKKGRKHKPNFRVPHPPSKTAPPGPGYSPQTLSFLSWRQLYANLTKINEAVTKEVGASVPLAQVGMSENAHKDALKKHFTFELEYDTREDEVYKMKDLTMRSWLNLAEKMGRSKYDPQSAENDYVDQATEMLAADGDEDVTNELTQRVEAVPLDNIANFLGSTTFDKDLDLAFLCALWLKNYDRTVLSKHDMPDESMWPEWFISALAEKINQIHLQAGNALVLEEKIDADDFFDKHHNSVLDDGSDLADDEEDNPHTENGDSVSTTRDKKKKKKKKKNKKHHKKLKKDKEMTLKKNHLWHAFVRRAFVGTKSDNELEDEFG